jgi:hypothetical protein
MQGSLTSRCSAQVPTRRSIAEITVALRSCIACASSSNQDEIVRGSFRGIKYHPKRGGAYRAQGSRDGD